MNNKYSQDSRILWYIAIIGVTGILIYLLSPILTPFLLAITIAYLCNPLVSWFETKKISRTLGTILVMFIAVSSFIAIALIMFPLFEREISRLAERLPSFLDLLNNSFVPWVERNLHIKLQINVDMLKQLLTENWQSAGGAAAEALPTIKSGSLAVLEFFINLVLVPVVLFYLLRDWNLLIQQIGELIPPVWKEKIFIVAKEADDVLAEFVRGEMAVIAIMSSYYVTGLWLAGLEFALPIGLVSGVLVFVPYLGAIIGFVLATLSALTQFQEWNSIILVWAVIGVGQLLEGMLITPKMVGDRIGLHPVIVIFSLMAFGQLFGFIGILLALPVSAVLLVLLRHLHMQYMEVMEIPDIPEIVTNDSITEAKSASEDNPENSDSG